MQQLGACREFWAIVRVNIEVTFVHSHLFCVKDVSVIRALLLGKPRQQICGISPTLALILQPFNTMAALTDSISCTLQ